MRSVENAECRKCGVWKKRSVENAECGKLSNRLMFFKTLSARLPNGFLISYNNPVIRTITINRFRKFESFGSFEEKFFRLKSFPFPYSYENRFLF